jgi:hypothetical protein
MRRSWRKIQKAAESVDISQMVETAAEESARALVGETLGRAPRRALPPAMMRAPKGSYNAETDSVPALAMGAEAVPVKASRNGRKPAPKSVGE